MRSAWCRTFVRFTAPLAASAEAKDQDRDRVSAFKFTPVDLKVFDDEGGQSWPA